MESALASMGLAGAPEALPSAPPIGGTPVRVTFRDGRLQLDNGNCRDTQEVVYYAGLGPRTTADCKVNEVDVPRVIGQPLRSAEERLRAQPLTPALVYAPARPRQPVNVVIRQYPASGTLSSYDRVTLVLAKPLHGVVPRVVGLSADIARARLRKAKLVASTMGALHGRVVAQRPAAGVAAAPGMRITLVRGTGG
jgi:hypothetical protein